MNKYGNTITQNLWDTKNTAKWKVHSNTGLPQETRNKSNKSPNSTTKATRKGRTGEPQS